MNVLTNHHLEIEKRSVISILETVDVTSKERKVLKEFDDLIEAPNWLKDGKHLIYNSLGHIYSYEIASGISICQLSFTIIQSYTERMEKSLNECF
jgi:hypothetical protein